MELLTLAIFMVVLPSWSVEGRRCEKEADCYCRSIHSIDCSGDTVLDNAMLEKATPLLYAKWLSVEGRRIPHDFIPRLMKQAPVLRVLKAKGATCSSIIEHLGATHFRIDHDCEVTTHTMLTTDGVTRGGTTPDATTARRPPRFRVPTTTRSVKRITSPKPGTEGYGEKTDAVTQTLTEDTKTGTLPTVTGSLQTTTSGMTTRTDELTTTVTVSPPKRRRPDDVFTPGYISLYTLTCLLAILLVFLYIYIRHHLTLRPKFQRCAVQARKICGCREQPPRGSPAARRRSRVSADYEVIELGRTRPPSPPGSGYHQVELHAPSADLASGMTLRSRTLPDPQPRRSTRIAALAEKQKSAGLPVCTEPGYYDELCLPPPMRRSHAELDPERAILDRRGRQIGKAIASFMNTNHRFGSEPDIYPEGPATMMVPVEPADPSADPFRLVLEEDDEVHRRQDQIPHADLVNFDRLPDVVRSPSFPVLMDLLTTQKDPADLSDNVSRASVDVFDRLAYQGAARYPLQDDTAVTVDSSTEGSSTLSDTVEWEVTVEVEDFNGGTDAHGACCGSSADVHTWGSAVSLPSSSCSTYETVRSRPTSCDFTSGDEGLYEELTGTPAGAERAMVPAPGRDISQPEGAVQTFTGRVHHV